MKSRSLILTHSRSPVAPRRFSLSLLASLAGTVAWLHAALPTPLVDMQFLEGAGETTTNYGSMGGAALLAVADGFPAFTNTAPRGPLAPANNTVCLDMGAIAANQGNRGVDLLTATDPTGALGALSEFTICGWLNARDLTIGAGGNRIAFALESPNGNGIDLVHLANGSLRIGINQWPDGASGGGPSSSSGKLKADPQLGTNNWVFFAVTYNPALEAGHVKFYFGGPSTLATLDVSRNYTGGIQNGGTVDVTGPLTLGNFGAVVAARTALGPTSSRVFRGLMDEFKIYDRALDLAEIQQAQLNGIQPQVPVTITSQPASQTVFAGEPVTFNVALSGAVPFNYQWQTNNIDVSGATDPTFTLPSAALTESGLAVRVRVGNPVTASLLSDVATLSVMPDSGHKISASFSEGGSTVTNRGNLEGQGRSVQRDGYPASSTIVPIGAFAPTNNMASIDFGAIVGTQGGRAIDFTNRFGNTLRPMNGFTICGWLNAVDLQTGGGGNRIVFALATAGGPGLDLVQLNDGSLQLGVNQFPDGSPARSSTGMIVADPNMAAENWVFFAVTYDGLAASGQATFYFGKGDQQAQLDVQWDYARGPIAQNGTLTLGNFGTVVSARTATGVTGSRCFRGLMDEINIYNKVLTLAEIQAVQTLPAYQPVQKDPVEFTEHPQSITVFEGSPVTFTAQFNGTPPFLMQWQRNGIDIPGATNATYVIAATTLDDHNAEFRMIVTNDLGSQTSQAASLIVLAETGQKILLSFSEGAGIVTANSGNLGGQGIFAQSNSFPAYSTNVPSGTSAPTNNFSSLDMGIIADGQGGRAVDLTNAFGNTLGSMNGFTVSGWLNAADLRVGFGGNRILFALAAPAGPGFDLVQLADGSLQLGVNQWPDGSPARSSAGWIAEDPVLGTANWLFFAVTYDGTQPAGNVSFYFGTADQAAQLDVSADYDRGPILQSGAVTVGNFGAVVAARTELGPAGGSRCFRGLLDELKVFNRVLTLEEIQAAQTAPAQVPIAATTLQIAWATNGAVELAWESPITLQLQSRDSVQVGSWNDVFTAPTVQGNRSSVVVTAGTGTQFFRLRGK